MFPKIISASIICLTWQRVNEMIMPIYAINITPVGRVLFSFVLFVFVTCMIYFNGFYQRFISACVFYPEKGSYWEW